MLLGKADGTQCKIQKMVYCLLDSVSFDEGHLNAPT